MTIVMGLDQHRAQITAEWLDTDTGEISRARVAPADRAGVRRFLSRFRGQALEVALEATTGWPFVVEELGAIGASVHLAEPAETAALRGNKKRAKNDRADARHLRVLLMAGRLPESWIPPDPILDLRARVRLRHALSQQRAEWQQRIQSVLYHHGCPKRGDLINAAGLAWLTDQPLAACAREQVTIALAMIDALDGRLAPLDKQLRDCARRQPGCQALIAAHYGIGPLVAVTILAELGDCRRFSSSREAVRYAGIDITVHASDRRRAPGRLSRQGPRRFAGRCSRPPNARGGAAHQTIPTTSRPPNASVATAPAWRSRANCSSAATTRCANSARRRCNPHDLAMRAEPFVNQMRRGQLPASSCRHQQVDGLHRQSGRNAFPKRDHPIKHHVAGPGANLRSWTEIRLGARAHKTETGSRRPWPTGRRTSRKHLRLRHKHKPPWWC